MEEEDRKKASSIKEILIDNGVKNREEALEYVRIVLLALFDNHFCDFPNKRLFARGIDDVSERLVRVGRPCACGSNPTACHCRCGGNLP
jgi:hypothetical protein